MHSTRPSWLKIDGLFLSYYFIFHIYHFLSYWWVCSSDVNNEKRWGLGKEIGRKKMNICIGINLSHLVVCVFGLTHKALMNTPCRVFKNFGVFWRISVLLWWSMTDSIFAGIDKYIWTEQCCKYHFILCQRDLSYVWNFQVSFWMAVILRTFLPGIIAVFLKAVNTTSQQSVLLVFLLDKFKHNLDFLCMKCNWKTSLFIDKG